MTGMARKDWKKAEWVELPPKISSANSSGVAGALSEECLVVVGNKSGEERMLAMLCPSHLKIFTWARPKKLSLNKQVICPKCSGSGSKKAGKSSVCGECRGQGVKLVVRQIGPGMVQQMQTTCPNCRGEGTAVDPKDRCGGCSGNRVQTEKKILEVHVEKGMKHGEKITFNREGDQHPDIKIPGDVIIVLQEKKHDVFEHNGQDLLMQKTITLKEALCGFSFPVQHLDGRILLVKSSPGEIIKPGCIKSIPNEGMPKHRNPFDKGYLLIKFEVEMPETLSDTALQTIAKVLPSPTRKEPAYDPNEAEECFLHNYASSSAPQREQEGSDEEESGGQRAQCVHQ
eukprot:NODE_1699_length_1409_cov_22.670827_g1613_i0.p1 GENE.NODE_1699_length_1409_cov_22.670827_g1613_i0~~NODE_1699_length_1409_cov_22.670827_g1613_i0.p1  ORF type:complete len:342 (+),score=94.04 NODE_1699_length_1409_cov_22.670827_g1613_i0:260-1285(+)